MSRRTSRSAAREAGAKPRRPDQSVAGDTVAGNTVDRRRCLSRPNKWFLAAAVMVQAAWIAFLAAMALLG